MKQIIDTEKQGEASIIVPHTIGSEKVQVVQILKPNNMKITPVRSSNIRKVPVITWRKSI